MLRMAFLSPCLFALISCAPPDQGQGASGESTSMSHPYDLTVLANSACYVAGAQQTVRQEADKLIATRVLVKEPGMCAQAVTEVVFSGLFPTAESDVRTLVLEIVDEAGVVLQVEEYLAS